MKHMKILGLLMVGAATLLAFAANASADELTSPTGTTYTGTIAAEAEGHAVLDNPIATIQCPMSIESKVEVHGSGKAVSGPVSELTIPLCTNSWHLTTVAKGTLSIESSSAGYNGTVFSNGATIENTRFGVTCRYATLNTEIGTFTGGKPATIDIKAQIPFHSGSFLCGEGVTPLTGALVVTNPTELYVDNT